MWGNQEIQCLYDFKHKIYKRRENHLYLPNLFNLYIVVLMVGEGAWGLTYLDWEQFTVG